MRIIREYCKRDLAFHLSEFVVVGRDRLGRRPKNGREASASSGRLRAATADMLAMSGEVTDRMATVRPIDIENGVERIPATMKAAVYRGVNDVRLEEVPVPEIGPGEMLVRVHTCGICGTDLKKISTGSHSAPRIFGHETSGVVAKVGAGVQEICGRRPRDGVSSHSVPRMLLLPAQDVCAVRSI